METIFDLMDDLERLNNRERAESAIAKMQPFEKYFILGLIRHEESEHGQAGVESVLAWIANREEH